MKIKLVLFLILLGCLPSLAQEKADSVNRKRINQFVVVSASSYTAGLLILNHAWYKDFEREPFHFFNDNKEWRQMDKVGHAWSSYHLTRAADVYFLKSGLSREKSFWFGSLTSFLMLTPIELLDGYSAAYGASLGDVGANLAGSAIYGLNNLVFKKPVLNMKLSFWPSNYADLRPELLGRNTIQQILKDYNGQTYWLTVDLHSYIEKVPPWLHLAIGYGADEMVYASEESNVANGYSSYRQMYLSFDLHLPSIFKPKRPWVQSLVNTINIIHLPAPALELSGRGNRFHILKF